jgi:hypothetical protein
MLTRLAAFVARYGFASIYTPPFEPPADNWSPYARTGTYADPWDPARADWWPSPALPSQFWPSAVFDEVRDALAALLLAGLRGATP